jgi:hypothetical protein
VGCPGLGLGLGFGVGVGIGIWDISWYLLAILDIPEKNKSLAECLIYLHFFMIHSFSSDSFEVYV